MSTSNNSKQNDNDEHKDIDLATTASSWCASNGMLMGTVPSKDDNNNNNKLQRILYEPAPFSLHPTPFPRPAFERAYAMSSPFNHVVHSAAETYWGSSSSSSSSSSWLRDAVRMAGESDPEFTGKMVELADEVAALKPEERGQRCVLGILRSDYMLHAPGGDGDDDGSVTSRRFQEAVPLQVELNTIASSFGCLSSKISKMHKHLEAEKNALKPEADVSDDGFLPENDAAEGIAEGLALAYKEYKRQRDGVLKEGDVVHPAVVVMVVQPGETNSVDQRDLEFLLLQKHGIRLVRQTLHDLATQSKHSTLFHQKELLLPSSSSPTQSVSAAVVYFRAGYTPNDYPTNTEWEGRRIVEHSSAIKCPDIFYHVFGTKKVQQALAEPGELKRFCRGEDEEQMLASSFAGLYALGGEDDEKVVEMALKDPHGFVLKPQREGGGNNLYDDHLVEALKTMSKHERGAFILMQKILPPSTRGVLVRKGGVAYDGQCVCELGVFGVSLRKYASDLGDVDAEVLHDKVVGHILRSKSVQTDEGGVAAGYAFLSSPRVV